MLEAALEAGVGAVQLREKDLDGGAMFARAERLAAACHAAGAKLLVNDRADVAVGAHADGVHLPADGIPVTDARGIVGTSALVGRSLHDRAELTDVDGADYVVFGPIFETPSKRSYGAPQGTARLTAIAEASRVPVLAIGGITPERVADVIACGAAGIAVMDAILSASSPAHVVRAFRAALREDVLFFRKSGW